MYDYGEEDDPVLDQVIIESGIELLLILLALRGSLLLHTIAHQLDIYFGFAPVFLDL